jgi:E3 ubiquitin-protein ligase NRDP1
MIPLNSETLCWDPSLQGTGLVLSESNTHVFLKEQAYVFRTIVGNIGFSSGVHYWEIIADSRTEN